MKNQITIPEVREVLKMTKGIAPILNDAECLSLLVFYQQVLDRYQKEEYPNGLPEEVAE